ncbi:MAG: TIGR00180 family glycosyltransferase [Alphaproteobacteria bacterium]
MSDPLRDEHTLLVTTYERPTYVYRLLRLLRSDVSVGRILLVDASSDAVKARNARTIAASGLAVEHMLCDHALSVIDLHEVAARAVNTPYVTFCADDDFIAPAFIGHAVDWLRDRPGHAACAGRLSYLGYDSDQALLSVGHNWAVEQDSALERFTGHLASFWSGEFATWRTKAKQDACRAFEIFKRDEVLGEPLHSLLMAIGGKIGVIDRLSVVRGLHEGNNANRFQEKRLCLVRDGFRADFDAFCALVESALSDVGEPPQDWEQFRRRLFDAVIRHIAFYNSYFKDSITTGILRKLWPTATRPAIEDKRQFLRRRISAELFGDDGSLVDARLPTGRHANVLRARNGTILRYDLSESASAAALLAPAQVEPTARCRQLIEALYDGRYARLHVRLRRELSPALLPDVSEPADLAFDALALQALVAELAPLHHMPAGVNRAIACALPIARGDAYELDLATELVGLATRFDNGKATPPDSFDVPLPQYRTVREFPDRDARALPGGLDIGAAKRAPRMTLIPLDTGYVARAFAEAPLWITANVRVLAGKIQIGVVCDGTMLEAPSVVADDGLQCVHLAIMSPKAEWLMIRDLAPDGEASRLEVSSIRLLQGRPALAETGDLPAAVA